MASSMQTRSDSAGTAGHEEPGAEHRQGSRRGRDTLARTGPLLALLIPIFLVYGLATLAGYTTDTVVLIVAVVVLLIATGVVISGVIKLTNVPPEDDDEGHEIS
jgi:hypothetical protein